MYVYNFHAVKQKGYIIKATVCRAAGPNAAYFCKYVPAFGRGWLPPCSGQECRNKWVTPDETIIGWTKGKTVEVHAVKELKLHAILPSALNEGEWLCSRLGCLISSKAAPPSTSINLIGGWVDQRGCLDMWKKRRKFIFPVSNRITFAGLFTPWHCHYTHWANPY
jgi:hypothetical protein